jgi:ABC-type molybdate transport system permease subunit
MQMKKRRQLLTILAPITVLMVIRNLFVSPFMALGIIGNATRVVRSHPGAEGIDESEILSVLQESIAQSNHEWMLTIVILDVVILIVLAVLIYRADARDGRVREG